MGTSNYLRFLLATLIVATAALVGWQTFGPPRVVTLAPDQYSFSATGDRTSGGNSVAELTPIESGVRLGCAISHGYQYPYCTTTIRLGDLDEGMDLTAYDTLRLKARYKGSGAPRMRVFLRDYEEGLSTGVDDSTLKVNEVWFDVSERGNVEIPLSVVRVASWWLSEHKVPLEKTGPRLDNVVMLEFSTAENIPDGMHTVDLQGIELVGRPFNQERLTKALLACWFVLGIATLTIEVLRYRKHYLEARKNLAQLQALNEALQIETRELADKALTDPLTGALNREGLRDFLVDRWRNAGGQRNALSVVFADIDHFKKINDAFGHGVGDEVLRQFSAILRDRLRSSDCLVRWGGEEFLIVCPGASLDQGCGLAEKLRKSLESAEWPEQIKVTASFGVAARAGEEDFGALIARADGHLYEAKRGGRNRVGGREAIAPRGEEVHI